MDKKQADKLGGEWGEAARSAWPWQDVRSTHDNLMTARLAMRYELAAFLPDDVEHALVVLWDGEPVVLALMGEALYRARVTYTEEDGSATARVEITRLFLDPASATPSVTTKLGSHHGVLWRWATWSFELDGEPLTIQSETMIDVPSTPPAEESFARALAQRLGWRVPAALTDASVAAA
jgi:hypothetical protein